MNGNGTETLEALLSELEGFEWDESDESDERSGRGRRGRRSPQTASGTGLSTPRPNSQYVTQTQLQTALAKVGAQIKTNSDAIKSISSRVSAQAEMLSKEVVARKKKTDELDKGLRQTREMSAILPLLSKPKTVQLSAAAVPAGTTPPRAFVDSDDTLSLLLPMMLMGGMGGSGSGGGGMFGGGDDNSMMMMMMVLALGK